MPKFISNEIKRITRKLRAEGLPIANIASILNLSRNTIYKILEEPPMKAILEIDLNSLSDNEKKLLEFAYINAKKLKGLSKTEVNSLLLKHGLAHWAEATLKVIQKKEGLS